MVLSLVFLKFISDKFEARRQKMKDEGQGDFLEMEVFYQQDNIFYLPEEARWSFIKQNAKQDDIAVRIDTALSTIEKRNPTLVPRAAGQLLQPSESGNQEAGVAYRHHR